MADRRMFHRTVVESDRFLDLPAGAQALYFHIGMMADDDGFVNGPKLIARQLKRPAKELQLLVDKGFLLDFDGIMVVKHWRVANYLKSDRIQLPKYPDIARKLYIKDTREYTKTRNRGEQNLLALKKNLLRDNGSHLEAQKRRAEKKKEEKKKEEKNIEEERGEESVSWEDGPAGALPPVDTDTELCFMKGKLGKGVVLLSQEQIHSLLDIIGLDSFDYYVERLADYILNNKRKVRNHYETILKWWNEDRSVNI